MEVFVLLLAWGCPGGPFPTIKLGILFPSLSSLIPSSLHPFICSFMYSSIHLFREPLLSACLEPLWSAVCPIPHSRAGEDGAAVGGGGKGCVWGCPDQKPCDHGKFL